LIRIFKFGGASVKDANGIRNASKIIQNQGQENNLVVVVSAMGKTTNALEILFEKAWNSELYEKEFNDLKLYHETIVSDLFGIGDVDSTDALSRYFTRLEFQLIHSKGIECDLGYDQVVTFGEYLSTLILSLYLRKKGVSVNLQNARFLIHTDMTWREGLVQMDETISSIRKNLEPLLKKGIVITQGFIGGAKNGLLTTLGREGSDYTAALLGHCLNAESVTIWKDVPGVLNADPKWLQGAVLLPNLSYQDAAELTYYGATVIHPKTIRPLAQKGIPLFVRSFLDPEKYGTRIGSENFHWSEPAFIVKKKQTLASFTSKDFSFMDEKNITEVLHAFNQENLKIQMLQISATSISVVSEIKKESLELITRHLAAQYSILHNDNLTLITIKNYSQEAINFVKGDNTSILDQRSRNTCQLLIRSDT
jgi:aspartate kinase